MKYIWRYIALWMTAMVLANCSKESYPGLEYVPSIPASLVNNESGRSTGMGMPVSLSVNGSTFQMTNVTRGYGPLDDVSNEERFDNTLFYVFAFRDNPDEQGSLAYNPSFLQHSAGDNPDCLVDNGDNDYLGMPAHIDVETGVVHMLRKNLRVDTTMYYGSRHQDNGYDFYLYHVDDFQPTASNAHRDETGIYYDMELDGTQDIMTGHSLKMTEEMLVANYPGYSGLSQEQRHHILNIGNYSAYAAYYDINPIIYMRHLLTQLNFYAYPADQSAREIQFTSVEITAQCAGRLYVVKKDFNGLTFEVDPNVPAKPIALQERSIDDTEECGPYQPLTPENYQINWDPETMSSTDWTQNPRVTIGDGMMLPTAASFRMKVSYRQRNNADPLSYRSVTAEYLLKAPELEESTDEASGEFMFLPSKTYAVKLGIYGGRTPTVVVGLDGGWEEGEDFDFSSDPAEEL